MKKVLSILLAVCLTVAAIPVFSVSAKAENILKNGDFSNYSESALSSATAAALNNQTWIHDTGTPCKIESAPVDSENHGYGIVFNSYLIQSMPTLKSNTTYTLSFDYMRAASATDEGINLRILIIERANPANVYRNDIINDGTTSKYGNYKFFTCSATAWKTKQYTFTTGELENQIYSICFVGVGKTTNGIMQLDNISVKEVVEPTNSGLIMDGDFEATEQIATFNVNSVADNTWYKKESKGNGVVTLSTDADHGNYVKVGDRGEIVQKVSDIKADEGAVITFKAKVDNGNNATNDSFTLYLCPKSWHDWYFGNIRFSPTAEWAEYTVIYNPQAGDSNSFNGKGVATGNMTPVQAGIDKINAGTGGSHTWDPEEEIILRILNNSKTASKPDVELYIDDIHIEKLDPFASNDLGQAELTGVSMRGANGSLPTAIRWKNAIAKTFAENGIGDFKVIEYGALVANTSTLESNNEKLTETATSPKVTGLAYNSTTSTSKLFDVTNDHNIFSLALYGITAENYGKALSVRPYAKVSNDKYTLTIYGESRSNSLFDACHAVLSGTNETDIALVQGILTADQAVKDAYLAAYPDDVGKL